MENNDCEVQIASGSTSEQTDGRQISSRTSNSTTTTKSKYGGTMVFEFKNCSPNFGIKLDNKETATKHLTSSRTTLGNARISEIQPKSLAFSDGRLTVGDKILAINGKDLSKASVERTRLYLNSALRGGRLSLTISREAPALNSGDADQGQKTRLLEQKRVAKKIHILKDSRGLGLQIAQRTDPASGATGIFVSHLDAGGAAARDGRIKEGDELLWINKHSLIGVTQQQAVDFLRSSPRLIQMVISTKDEGKSASTKRLRTPSKEDIKASPLNNNTIEQVGVEKSTRQKAKTGLGSNDKKLENSKAPSKQGTRGHGLKGSEQKPKDITSATLSSHGKRNGTEWGSKTPQEKVFKRSKTPGISEENMRNGYYTGVKIDLGRAGNETIIQEKEELVKPQRRKNSFDHVNENVMDKTKISSLNGVLESEKIEATSTRKTESEPSDKAGNKSNGTKKERANSKTKSIFPRLTKAQSLESLQRTSSGDESAPENARRMSRSSSISSLGSQGSTGSGFGKKVKKLIRTLSSDLIYSKAEDSGDSEPFSLEGYEVLSVNGSDMTSVTHREALDFFKNIRRGVVTIKVRTGASGLPSASTFNTPEPSPHTKRRSSEERETCAESSSSSAQDSPTMLRRLRHKKNKKAKHTEIVLHKEPDTSLGVGLGSTPPAELNGKQGLFIQYLVEGSPAALDGRLSKGDQLMEVNEKNISTTGIEKTYQLLNTLPAGKITLRVIKAEHQQAEALPSHLNTALEKMNSERNLLDKKMRRPPTTGIPSDKIRAQESGESFDDIMSISSSNEALLPFVPKTEENVKTGRVFHPEESALSSAAKKHSQIEMVTLKKLATGELGMGVTIDKSRGSTVVEGVFIKSVASGKSADQAQSVSGGLRPGDEILEVNGIFLRYMDQEDVIKIFRDLPVTTIMKVNRAKQATPIRGGNPAMLEGAEDTFEHKESENKADAVPEGFTKMTVEIEKQSMASLGVSLVPSFGKLKGYFQVRRILPGSVCDRNGKLQPGDRLISMNGESLTNVTHSTALHILKKPTDKVVLVILRDVHDLTSEAANQNIAVAQVHKPSSNRVIPKLPPPKNDLKSHDHVSKHSRDFTNGKQAIASEDSKTSKHSNVSVDNDDDAFAPEPPLSPPPSPPESYNSEPEDSPLVGPSKPPTPPPFDDEHAAENDLLLSREERSDSPTNVAFREKPRRISNNNTYTSKDRGVSLDSDTSYGSDSVFTSGSEGKETSRTFPDGSKVILPPPLIQGYSNIKNSKLRSTKPNSVDYPKTTPKERSPKKQLQIGSPRSAVAAMDTTQSRVAKSKTSRDDIVAMEMTELRSQAKYVFGVRHECEPFVIEFQKKFRSLGIKAGLNDSGRVVVTEVSSFGLVGKDGNIRVGDYLLSINDIKLDNKSAEEVNQLLKTCPKGIVTVEAKAGPEVSQPTPPPQTPSATRRTDTRPRPVSIERVPLMEDTSARASLAFSAESLNNINPTSEILTGTVPVLEELERLSEDSIRNHIVPSQPTSEPPEIQKCLVFENLGINETQDKAQIQITPRLQRQSRVKGESEECPLAKEEAFVISTNSIDSVENEQLNLDPPKFPPPPPVPTEFLDSVAPTESMETNELDCRENQTSPQPPDVLEKNSLQIPNDLQETTSPPKHDFQDTISSRRTDFLETDSQSRLDVKENIKFVDNALSDTVKRESIDASLDDSLSLSPPTLFGDESEDECSFGAPPGWENEGLPEGVPPPPSLFNDDLESLPPAPPPPVDHALFDTSIRPPSLFSDDFEDVSRVKPKTKSELKVKSKPAHKSHKKQTSPIKMFSADDANNTWDTPHKDSKKRSPILLASPKLRKKHHSPPSPDLVFDTTLPSTPLPPKALKLLGESQPSTQRLPPKALKLLGESPPSCEPDSQLPRASPKALKLLGLSQSIDVDSSLGADSDKLFTLRRREVEVDPKACEGMNELTTPAIDDDMASLPPAPPPPVVSPPLGPVLSRARPLADLPLSNTSTSLDQDVDKDVLDLSPEVEDDIASLPPAPPPPKSPVMFSGSVKSPPVLERSQICETHFEHNLKSIPLPTSPIPCETTEQMSAKIPEELLPPELDGDASCLLPAPPPPSRRLDLKDTQTKRHNPNLPPPVPPPSKPTDKSNLRPAYKKSANLHGKPTTKPSLPPPPPPPPSRLVDSQDTAIEKASPSLPAPPRPQQDLKPVSDNSSVSLNARDSPGTFPRKASFDRAMEILDDILPDEELAMLPPPPPPKVPPPESSRDESTTNAAAMCPVKDRSSSPEVEEYDSFLSSPPPSKNGPLNSVRKLDDPKDDLPRKPPPPKPRRSFTATLEDLMRYDISSQSTRSTATTSAMHFHPIESASSQEIDYLQKFDGPEENRLGLMEPELITDTKKSEQSHQTQRHTSPDVTEVAQNVRNVVKQPSWENDVINFRRLSRMESNPQSIPESSSSSSKDQELDFLDDMMTMEESIESNTSEAACEGIDPYEEVVHLSWSRNKEATNESVRADSINDENNQLSLCRNDEQSFGPECLNAENQAFLNSSGSLQSNKTPVACLPVIDNLKGRKAPPPPVKASNDWTDGRGSFSSTRSRSSSEPIDAEVMAAQSPKKRSSSPSKKHGFPWKKEGKKDKKEARSLSPSKKKEESPESSSKKSSSWKSKLFGSKNKDKKQRSRSQSPGRVVSPRDLSSPSINDSSEQKPISSPPLKQPLLPFGHKPPPLDKRVSIDGIHYTKEGGEDIYTAVIRKPRSPSKNYAGKRSRRHSSPPPPPVPPPCDTDDVDFDSALEYSDGESWDEWDETDSGDFDHKPAKRKSVVSVNNGFQEELATQLGKKRRSSRKKSEDKPQEAVYENFAAIRRFQQECHEKANETAVKEKPKPKKPPIPKKPDFLKLKQNPRNEIPLIGSNADNTKMTQTLSDKPVESNPLQLIGTDSTYTNLPDEHPSITELKRPVDTNAELPELTPHFPSSSTMDELGNDVSTDFLGQPMVEESFPVEESPRFCFKLPPLPVEIQEPSNEETNTSPLSDQSVGSVQCDSPIEEPIILPSEAKSEESHFYDESFFEDQKEVETKDFLRLSPVASVASSPRVIRSLSLSSRGTSPEPAVSEVRRPPPPMRRRSSSLPHLLPGGPHISTQTSLQELINARNEGADIEEGILSIQLLKEDQGIGLMVIGGLDTPLGMLYIKDIQPGTPAEKCGHLRTGDQLLQVNDECLVGVTHAYALEVLKNTPPLVKLTVARKKDREELEVDNLGRRRVVDDSKPLFQTAVESSTVPKTATDVTLSPRSARDMRPRPLSSFGTPKTDDPRYSTMSSFDTDDLENDPDRDSSTLNLCQNDVPVTVIDGIPGEASSSEEDVRPSKSVRWALADRDSDVFTVELKKDSKGSLGIHVSGGVGTNCIDVTVRHVVPLGVAAKDGRIRKGDRVLSVNGRSTKGLTHQEVLNLLQNLPRRVVLVVSRSNSPRKRSLSLSSLNILHNKSSEKEPTTESDAWPTKMESPKKKNLMSPSDVNPPSLEKIPLTLERENTDSTYDRFKKRLFSGGNGKAFKEILQKTPPEPSVKEITLEKGPSGLGFSVGGGRDSLYGDTPIYIKYVFKDSASSRSGLEIGDEVLEVNGRHMRGMTNVEALETIRALPYGAIVIRVRRK
ncbi:uncharacterized protein LOC5517610 isoform X2 [Nematostella vectensis]|uniref:uncharacterized protein LOC5517610 isoform X2 n=1 Tax=Nematostella vectensis TaxID=45351 RepID=UPI00207775C7|nr:uncharacterized protein LOC5517610 isoform X2 [Nematostella vectensis]